MCNMASLRRIGPGALAGLESLSKLHLSLNPQLAEIDPKALARADDIGETYVWPPIKEVSAYIFLISNFCYIFINLSSMSNPSILHQNLC